MSTQVNGNPWVVVRDKWENIKWENDKPIRYFWDNGKKVSQEPIEIVAESTIVWWSPDVPPPNYGTYLVTLASGRVTFANYDVHLQSKNKAARWPENRTIVAWAQLPEPAGGDIERQKIWAEIKQIDTKTRDLELRKAELTEKLKEV